MDKETMRVQFEGFEGPLDLLLHLIQTLEIDIYNIPMTLITEQYMQYINTMKELQLDIASKYMVMAATLLSIKSKMLLPVEEERQQSDDYDDPRQPLVEQLLEYQKIKEAAVWFDQEQEQELGFYSHDVMDLSGYIDQTTLDPDEHHIADLQRIMQRVIQKQSEINQPVKTVAKEEISLNDEMTQLYDLVCHTQRIDIYQRMLQQSLEHNVVTFLAILELVKNNKLILLQNGTFEPLYIQKREDSHG